MSRSSSAMSREAFELPQTTWDIIQDNCPEREASEVKRVLGQSLIEEACDLYAEASSLLEIWHQMREETDPGRSHDGDAPFPLAEPPGVRSKLVQEIKFLVTYLQKRDISSPVLNEPAKSTIINYAFDSTEDDHPSTTVSYRDGRDTPLRPSSLGESTSSSTVDSLVASSSISIIDIDRLVSELQQSVKDEIEQRKKDIEFLQTCIESEMLYQSKPVPTLKDLQVVNCELEKELLRESDSTIATNYCHSTLHPVTHKPLSNCAIRTSQSVSKSCF